MLDDTDSATTNGRRRDPRAGRLSLANAERGQPYRAPREAQILASLNHSNIAVIHDVQEVAGTHFLVLELVEGETLAQRLDRGRLEVDEALEVCRQVAEALEAAHGKDVLHRDLKPVNIQLTPDGRVKVLDFGLAKMTQPEEPLAGSSNSPTMLSVGQTGQGVILGTAAYMSPEQARGRAVDKGTDIWAFGCVLFEALTASPAFNGEDVPEILADIMKSEPDWGDCRPTRRMWCDPCFGTLMAVAFDAERLELKGSPVAVLDNVMQAVNPLWNADETGSGQFGVAANGTLVDLSGGIHPTFQRDLVWVDRKGEFSRLAVQPGAYFAPRVSPDAKRVVFHAQRERSREYLMWSYDISRQTATRLAPDGDNCCPVCCTSRLFQVQVKRSGFPSMAAVLQRGQPTAASSFTRSESTRERE